MPEIKTAIFEMKKKKTTLDGINSTLKKKDW